jgi:redox-sensitive bicupin YhaK (pirin superfamily)
VAALPGGGQVKVIAGTFGVEGREVSGPVNGGGAKLSTDPLYVDVHLPANAVFKAPLGAGRNAFLYAYEGSAAVGPQGQERALPHRAAGVLSDGEGLRVVAGPQGVRFLLLAAKPLREPVVQYGPFVMNTREEIEQALADYRDGKLAAAA